MEFVFRIVENKRVTGKDYLLTVEVDKNIVEKIKPGQFAMVQVRDKRQLDPLLRRPLGIFNVERNEVSFLYRVYGRGTELLTEVKEEISILLPLGNYFEDDSEKYLFIAGGIGIGGLFYTARLFSEKGREVKFLYGERNRENLSGLEFLKKYNIDFEVYTEDGSYGKKGLVTADLERYRDYKWLACGPTPMLKAIKELAEKLDVNCLLSLDRRMACGVGACLGCTVKTTKGYQRCCVEGPIFNSKIVLFD
ncbi:Dihydroorotate dehydrogenase, electron transfer subunit, iron-sulfur cluster binding domain [Desulfurobacterium thermolithotrophum DSM 11699]|uniref:Dihydroorotate dehydrogenase, electron transfer subunit, iron-sulfur cluster binding domain n=1 Tax=Desulfurobacterium thermolithotrophum (strain DSM 11699 / BSA) TaxID=868864 RepID=F0S1A2_DESTD|nr:dihydroorotate dehydrogenase electron transfer subunit [Desulfurobacterium thermolithotrophum]ADY72833.1 Dihydroorotate dehydrogenase, electron transfer subunit, iron-sulfur cluster binding domain [Desulfurobacterium thermolithotrophum DSM 11699]